MASEIRVNKIENRSGLGTVTFADTGVDLAGIVTATTFSGSGASLTALPAAQLSGTLPAISAANLTNVPAANITGTLPAISAANLTNVPAANITGTLPALSAANLTSIPAANVTGTLPAITAANLTNIPAANIVGVCTSGLTKTGGFGGGKVLQIVQRHDTSFTRNAHASSSYADTAHYVEITPTAASSKILVNISSACNNNGSGNVIYLDIYRSINGGTYESISPNGSSVPTAGFTLNKMDNSRSEIPFNIIYLDSPSYSLGNAIIYKLYMRNNGSGSVEVPSNPGGEPVMCIAQEIAA